MFNSLSSATSTTILESHKLNRGADQSSERTGSPALGSKRIAVLIPCFNEELTIAQVVRDFQQALPSATIFVYDNNSSDDTKKKASEAGAVVRTESAQGKGNVIRRMFADIDADIYVMVDGDDTYNALDVPSFLEHMLLNNLDMVNGQRVHEHKLAYRFGHEFGNRLLTGLVGMFFRKEFSDMLSGLKVFTRRYVKSFPALTRGFDIETELTIHALEMRMATGEMNIRYKERPEGSVSKLNTVRDGIRILTTIGRFLKEERPLQFFGSLALVVFVAAIALAIPLILTFLETGLVPRFPTAILIVGMVITAFLGVTAGLILDTVTRGRQEMKRLMYLSYAGLLSEKDLDAR